MRETNDETIIVNGLMELAQTRKPALAIERKYILTAMRKRTMEYLAFQNEDKNEQLNVISYRIEKLFQEALAMQDTYKWINNDIEMGVDENGDIVKIEPKDTLLKRILNKINKNIIKLYK